MSHTTRVSDVRIHDIAVLKKALQQVATERGVHVTIMDNAACKLWGSSTEHCDVVARFNGCRFDVGFKKAKDGNGYEPVFDSHGGELYRVVGQGKEVCVTREDHNLSNIAAIMQRYAQNMVYQTALTNGAQVQQTTVDGSAVMRIMG